MGGCSEIGKRIKALREAKSLRQSDVADALHIARSNYAKMESGDRDLKTEYCIAMANYFNVTCDYLLRGIPAENVDICRQTGLSNEAAVFLRNLSSSEELCARQYIELLSVIISDVDFIGKCVHAMSAMSIRDSSFLLEFFLENNIDNIEMLVDGALFQANRRLYDIVEKVYSQSKLYTQISTGGDE